MASEPPTASHKPSAAGRHRPPEAEPSETFGTATALQDAPPRENLVSLARRLFGADRGIDLDIPPRGAALNSIPPDLSTFS